jgi:predicted DNA-binding transcriptional regulator AlpA
VIEFYDKLGPLRKAYLQPSEAAEALGVTRATVWNWANAGAIRVVYLPVTKRAKVTRHRRIRIPVKAVLQILRMRADTRWLQMPDTESRFWTVKRAAAYMGVSLARGYEFVKSGAWPSVRFGPSIIRIPVSEFMETIDKNTTHAKEIPCKRQHRKNIRP